MDGRGDYAEHAPPAKAPRRQPGRGAFTCDVLFTWMSPTMRLGTRQPLQHEDLPLLLPGDSVASMASERPPGRGLYGVLRSEARTFATAGVSMFVFAVCQVLSPVALYALLLCAEERAGQASHDSFLPSSWLDRKAMLPCVLVFVCLQVAAALANHWQMHLSYHIGQRLRAQLIHAVFNKAVTVDPSTRPQTAKVLNLMAMDSQKFLEALPFLHQLWSAPLQMVVATGCLVSLVGPASLFGVAVIASLIPISKRCAAAVSLYRSRHLAESDVRVRLCVEMLTGIRCIKYFAWERPYLSRIFEKRRAELHWAMRETLVYMLSMVFTVMGPAIAFAVMLLGHVVFGSAQSFTASIGFGALALLQALRFPLMNLGSVLGSVVALWTSAKRLQAFLQLDDVPSETCTGENGKLELDGCCFGYTLESGEWNDVLSDVSFTVGKGELVVVLGRVGCGKSTLLQGVIGEVLPRAGSLHRSRGIGYCPQQAWVLNATLRDNVLFGADLDPKWYESVLRACCLLADLKQLPQGDQTEIGERGVTLSGGQKQRVALARAVYKKECHLLLFDDVFSALDSHTGRTVMENLFGRPDGLLRDRAVLLAGHGSACAEIADRIILLGSGSDEHDGEVSCSRVLFDGTWKELVALPHLFGLVRAEAHLDSVVDDHADSGSSAREAQAEDAGAMNSSIHIKQKALMTDEQRDVGGISWKHLRAYIDCVGGPHVVLVFIFSCALERFFFCGIDWWLSRWTSEDPGNQRVGYYYGIYCAIIGVAAVFVSSSRLILGPLSIWAARSLFERMAVRVVRAPTNWFDTTPLGRILNRFSFDTEMVDTTFVTKFFPAAMSISWMTGAVAIICGVLWPYSLLILPLPVLPYYWLFQYSRKSIRELQRLDSMSRSPIQSTFAETLHGVASVRAYGCESRYSGILAQHVDKNSAAVLAFNTASRWLGVRLEMLGISTTGIVALACWLLEDLVTPSLAGLCLIWSLNFTISLNFNCLFWSQAEAAFTSVERLSQYAADVPLEGAHIALDDWPGVCKGGPSVRLASTSSLPSVAPLSSVEGAPCIAFDKVSLRYREGLPLVLRDVSFELQMAERVAVVGRTGAGKSSLAVALFQLVPLSGGCVRLAGEDLSALPLDVARRSLSIITQDPVVFSGTVRYNLDPFDEYTDGDCENALRSAQLWGVLGLDTPVEDAGANRSVGERQLICLARALLGRPRLLLCDEATSSVDERTDALVQQCLREVSSTCGTALLTIAHRLLTVADYDRVIVMDSGQVVEMGHPHELLTAGGEHGAGAFQRLVEQAGASQAKAIRRLASKGIGLNDESTGIGLALFPMCCASGIAAEASMEATI